MEIANLIFLKEQISDILKKVSLENSIVEKKQEFQVLKNIVPEHELIRLQDHINYFDQMLDLNKNLILSLENKITDISNQIQNCNQLLLNDPAYLSKFTEDNIVLITETNDDIEHAIVNRVSLYSNWKYPGLLLNCRFSMPDHEFTPKLKERIDAMVGSDPLYIVCCRIRIAEMYVENYTSLYQSRVRKYEATGANFDILPQAQFGFIQCWDFFNHLPTTTIEEHLRQILNLLRPGGVVLFSYSNCELIGTAKQFDLGEIPFGSATIIKNIAQSLGFEIVDMFDYPTTHKFSPPQWVSWVELKKPGTLQTIKRHQPLGKIEQK